MSVQEERKAIIDLLVNLRDEGITRSRYARPMSESEAWREALTAAISIIRIRDMSFDSVTG